MHVYADYAVSWLAAFVRGEHLFLPFSHQLSLLSSSSVPLFNGSADLNLCQSFLPSLSFQHAPSFNHLPRSRNPRIRNSYNHGEEQLQSDDLAGNLHKLRDCSFAFDWVVGKEG